MFQTTVNLTPCSIKHTSRCLWYKVPRLDMCRSIISLSKTTHQIWCDHPFSQRTRQQKEHQGWNLQATRNGRGQTIQGVFIKQGGQDPSANYGKLVKTLCFAFGRHIFLPYQLIFFVLLSAKSSALLLCCCCLFVLFIPI